MGFINQAIDSYKQKKILDTFGKMMVESMRAFHEPNERQIREKQEALSNLSVSYQRASSEFSSYRPESTNVENPVKVNSTASQLVAEVQNFSTGTSKKILPKVSKENPKLVMKAIQSSDRSSKFNSPPVQNGDASHAITASTEYLSERIDAVERAEKAWINDAVLPSMQDQNKDIAELKSLGNQTAVSLDTINENINELENTIAKSVAFSAAESTETSKAGDKQILEAINKTTYKSLNTQKGMLDTLNTGISSQIKVTHGLLADKVKADNSLRNTIATAAREAVQFAATAVGMMSAFVIPGIQSIITSESNNPIIKVVKSILSWLTNGGFSSMGDAFNKFKALVEGALLGRAASKIASGIVSLIPGIGPVVAWILDKTHVIDALIAKLNLNTYKQSNDSSFGNNMVEQAGAKIYKTLSGKLPKITKTPVTIGDVSLTEQNQTTQAYEGAETYDGVTTANPTVQYSNEQITMNGTNEGIIESMQQLGTGLVNDGNFDKISEKMDGLMSGMTSTMEQMLSEKLAGIHGGNSIFNIQSTSNMQADAESMKGIH